MAGVPLGMEHPPLHCADRALSLFQLFALIRSGLAVSCWGLVVVLFGLFGGFLFGSFLRGLFVGPALGYFDCPLQSPGDCIALPWKLPPVKFIGKDLSVGFAGWFGLLVPVLRWPFPLRFLRRLLRDPSLTPMWGVCDCLPLHRLSPAYRARMGSIL